jgi:site-specific recombinase XerD
MTQRLAASLMALRHLRGPRVLYHDDGRSPTSKVIRTWMLAAQRKAGLPGQKGGIHVLRHSFCSHLAMRGAPVKAIQELAGHTTLAMTTRYMHLTPSAKESAIALLDHRPTEDSEERGTLVAPNTAPARKSSDNE